MQAHTERVSILSMRPSFLVWRVRLAFFWENLFSLKGLIDENNQKKGGLVLDQF